MSEVKAALRIARAGNEDARKEWFGKSKIVDKNGRPRVVYHGTGGDFGAFATKNSGAGSRESPIGHWFTNHPEAASQFADFAARGNGAAIMPAHIRLENPFVANSYNDIRDLVDAHTQFQKPGYVVGGRQIRMTQDKVDYDAARNALKAKGHDGIILKNTMTDSPDGKTPIDQYVVFDPTQIKSSVGNNGNFDRNDPDITKKKGGMIDNAIRIAREHGGRIKLHVGPIHSRVSGRTDHLPVHVPSGAYVLPSDIVSAMGEGNTLAGFEHVKRMFGGLPYHGKGNIPYGGGEGPYGSDLPKADGGSASNVGAPVPCVLAGGEFVLDPDQVMSAGDGDMDAGHKALDAFVNQYRAKTIKTLKGLPGPKKD